MTTDPAEASDRTEAGTQTVPFPRRAAFAVTFGVLGVAGVRAVAVSTVENLDRFDPLGFGQLVGAATVGAIGGAVVYAALHRLRDDANRLFTRIAAAVTVLSFVPLVAVGPTLPGATPTALVLLGLAHLSVAVGVVVALIGRLGPLAG